MAGPQLSKFPALLEEIRSQICPLHLVADLVVQRPFSFQQPLGMHLGDPVHEGRSETLKSGKYRDGEGLQFEVKGGSRRWTFSYMLEGRQRELAIGKYPAMSLADARAKRAELREAKDRGLDPKTVLAGTAVLTRAITFRQDMD